MIKNENRKPKKEVCYGGYLGRQPNKKFNYFHCEQSSFHFEL